MLAFLSLIPGIGTLISTIVSAVFNAKVQIMQAKTGADQAVATKLIQAAAQQEHENTARLSVIANNKFLTLLLIAAALPLVGYEWKIYVWDTMLGWGSTEPVKGQVADWGNTIIYFLFGSPTVMGLGKMWFSRKTS